MFEPYDDAWLTNKFEMIVAEEEGDTEAVHARMDKVMVELLRKMGYEDAMSLFEITPKWYA